MKCFFIIKDVSVTDIYFRWLHNHCVGYNRLCNPGIIRTDASAADV